MLILEIKNYIQEHKRISFKDLAQKFSIDKQHLRFLLAKWVAKGELDHFTASASCATSACGCNSCVIEAFETFQWRQ